MSKYISLLDEIILCTVHSCYLHFNENMVADESVNFYMYTHIDPQSTNMFVKSDCMMMYI